MIPATDTLGRARIALGVDRIRQIVARDTPMVASDRVILVRDAQIGDRNRMRSARDIHELVSVTHVAARNAQILTSDRQIAG